MRLISCILLVCWSSLALIARPEEPILVTDQTVRIRGEQRFFYALEEGDALRIRVTSVDGKLIRQASVRPYEGDLLWESEPFSSFTLVQLPAVKRAVYEIRIHAGGHKDVRLQVHRIPKYPSRAVFDTQVQWRTVTDTIRRHYQSRTQVVYDTSYPTRYRRVHYQTTQHTHALANRTERVHSKTHLQEPSYSSLSFDLPALQQTEQYEERLLGVAYWIGVGQEGLEHYNQELKKFLGTAAVEVGKKNLLAGLAVGAYAVAVNPPQGDNIHYQWGQGPTAILDQGNVTTAYGRFSNLAEAPLQLTLTNDNILNGLNVHLKLVAVVERRHYRQEGYQERVVTPLTLEQTRGKVRLVERQVPVINHW